MRRPSAVGVGVLALLAWLPACGDDGGGEAVDPELVTLLEEEAGQTGAIASCAE